MEEIKQLQKDIAPILIGQAIGIALVAGIFALAGSFDLKVLLGSLGGAALASANFFILYFTACKAAEKAKNQDVTGGQKLIHLSYMSRMIGLLLGLIILAKSGWCNVIALAIPLALNRPILTIDEWIRKKGGAKA